MPFRNVSLSTFECVKIQNAPMDISVSENFQGLYRTPVLDGATPSRVYPSTARGRALGHKLPGCWYLHVLRPQEHSLPTGLVRMSDASAVFRIFVDIQ